MVKYITIQILVGANAVITSTVLHLPCNNMSFSNVAMRMDKQSVSVDLCRCKLWSHYQGQLGFTGEYTQVVVKVYEEYRE